MKFIHEALKNSFEYRELSKAFQNNLTPAVLTGVTAVHKAAVIYSLLNETKIGAVLDLWFSFEEETLPTE